MAKLGRYTMLPDLPAPPTMLQQWATHGCAVRCARRGELAADAQIAERSAETRR